jgi:tol-pal system protein YbgF
VEQLTHQLDLVSQKADRLQKQLDYTAANPPAAQNGGDSFAADGSFPPGPPSNQPANQGPRTPQVALAPASGTLGTLPAGAPVPKPGNPQPAADAQGEFDAAMGLLTRAQYDRAAQSFRTFADSHPDSDLGAQALYWTGDIAYSAKNDYDGAARSFAELLKKYPKAQRAPEGMLKLGLSLIALGQKQEGCAALAALPAKYPNAGAAVVNRSKAERKNACA